MPLKQTKVLSNAAGDPTQDARHDAQQQFALKLAFGARWQSQSSN